MAQSNTFIRLLQINKMDIQTEKDCQEYLAKQNKILKQKFAWCTNG